MMEIYRNTIDSVRNYNLDPKEVIKGLNGYYESDKRNGYITVKRNDVEGPAYLSTTIYLSALIEWLRVDHDIFYRPGMTLDQIEAARNAAKMCGLRAHIKDEISKRGLWCGADEDIPELVDTLFKAYDKCRERADNNRKDAVKLSKEIRCVVNEKESAIEKLKDRIEELESNFKAVCDEDDIFRARALKAEEEVRKLKEQLKDSQKADTNKLIRDYCTKNDIAAPSRYLSDEACIEYLFSVSVTILQDLYRDIFKKQPDGLSAEDIANKILDRVLETRDEWTNYEIENLRGKITTLKDLINAMNEEVGDM